MRKIGIMGGTFDPIHYGHLVTAEEAREQFCLDEVVFVPSGKPPHKKNRVVSEANHRCAMVELAIASNPYFSLSRFEVERREISYAATTVDAFRRQYGEKTALYFITGADAIKAIMSWHKIEELMARCSFIAASRPGYDFDKNFHLPPFYREAIFPLKVTALAISSSQIREAAAQGQSIKYLLPETVEVYIKAHNLYKEKVDD